MLYYQVEPEFKQALERLAKEENRSLSNYVQTVLLQHLIDKGIDPNKPPREIKVLKL